MALFGQVGSFPDDVVLTVFYFCDESRPLRINGDLHKIAYRHRVGAAYAFQAEVAFDFRINKLAVVRADGSHQLPVLRMTSPRIRRS